MGLLSLLENGGLSLGIADAAEDAVAPWIPRTSPGTVHEPSPAHIDVREGGPRLAQPASVPPSIRVLGLRGWTSSDHAHLTTPDESVTAVIDLHLQRATIRLAAAHDDADFGRHTFAALTVSAALLLGRQDRVLLHAGGVVAPNGGAWLLVGDSHSGKSSTCATLVRAGWAFLADDQVIVAEDRETRELHAEGWPRSFNLDDGYTAGTVTGTRSPAEPAMLGGGEWHRSAPVAGLLFPSVSAPAGTALVRAAPGAAIQQLIRQSPWLLADPGAAPSLLQIMERLAGGPVYSLTLGMDSYASPETLVRALQPALVAGH